MKTTLFALILSMSFGPFSCHKNKEADITKKMVEGLWVGTYTVDQMPEQEPLYYNFVIKPDGNLLTEGVGADGVTYYHKGSWDLKGNVLTATYTTLNRRGPAVTQSAKITLTADGALINGTWTDMVNRDGHLDGKFQNLTKIK